jgi:hypothetical protein
MEAMDLPKTGDHRIPTKLHPTMLIGILCQHIQTVIHTNLTHRKEIEISSEDQPMRVISSRHLVMILMIRTTTIATEQCSPLLRMHHRRLEVAIILGTEAADHKLLSTMTEDMTKTRLLPR